MEEQKDFFFSKYSNYSPEQIQTSTYEKLSSFMLKIVQNEEIKEKMKRNFI